MYYVRFSRNDDILYPIYSVFFRYLKNRELILVLSLLKHIEIHYAWLNIIPKYIPSPICKYDVTVKPFYLN